MNDGFLVNDGEYACIPYGKRGYIIIHQGSQLERICRTQETARKYINEHRKLKFKK